MKKNIILVIAIVAFLMLASYVYVLDVYWNEERINTDTETWRKDIWVGIPGEKLNVGGFCEKNELVYEEIIPTAWNSDTPTDHVFSLSSSGGQFPDLACWWGSYWWEVTFDDGSTVETIIQRDGNSEEWVQVLTDDGLGEHYFGNSETNGACGLNAKFCDITSKTWYYEDAIGSSANLVDFYVEPLEFKILGPHTGVLNATLYLDGLTWDDTIDTCPHHCDFSEVQIPLITDQCLLKSGAGDVYILDNPEYGDKIYEEGQTLKFEVTTGYAGNLTTPWKLVMLDGNNNPYKGANIIGGGSTYETDQYGAIYLSNEHSNFLMTWDIPYGAYIPDSPTQWHLTLYNSFYTEKTDYFFTLYEGAIDDVPGPTTLTVLNAPPQGQFFDVNDVVEIRMSADENPDAPDGYDGIFEFELYTYYGSQTNPGPHQYVQTVPSDNVDGTWTVETTFEVDQNAEWLVIEARAFSNPGYLNGGLPGAKDYESYWIPEDPDEVVIKVYVTLDDTPIRRALVLLNRGDLMEDYTDQYGLAYFAGDKLIQGSRVTVTASHPDSNDAKSRVITLTTGENEVSINLEGGISINIILGAIIAIVVLVIFLVVAYMLPLMIPYKILVIAVGAAIAILIFLYFFMQMPI